MEITLNKMFSPVLPNSQLQKFANYGKSDPLKNHKSH